MLVEEIEMVRGQMQEVSAREEALLRSLAESIHEAEQRLLRHVRDIAERHNESRSQLLGELKSLASGLGQFPALDAAASHSGEPAVYEITSEATSRGYPGGHWREATRMIAEDDSLETLLRANAR